ncbi:dnaJ homolog subfamily C member 30, mitochondrial-like [Ornithodoros turicata]|uniref:dnaJ homolog subfamily C member 30, mitochondrial-like n=1 Tax=Ornithodoros turicata TaxID=34597 RepID=UPI0031393871
MKYHPDKNKGSDAAAVLFHEITKAYDTLSNENLRSKYDDEVLGVSRRRQKEEDLKSGAAFHRSRQDKRQHGVHTGRSHVYNFDEFYKQHYGDAVHSYQVRKAKYEDMTKQEAKEGGLGYSTFALIYAVVIVSFVIDFFFGREDPDRPTSAKKTPSSKEK